MVEVRPLFYGGTENMKLRSLVLISSLLALVLVFNLEGCARIKVQKTIDYGGMREIPRPTRVLVHKFTAPAYTVALDQSPGKKLARNEKGLSQSQTRLSTWAISRRWFLQARRQHPPPERPSRLRHTGRAFAEKSPSLMIHEGEGIRSAR